MWKNDLEISSRSFTGVYLISFKSDYENTHDSYLQSRRNLITDGQPSSAVPSDCDVSYALFDFRINNRHFFCYTLHRR